MLKIISGATIILLCGSPALGSPRNDRVAHAFNYDKQDGTNPRAEMVNVFGTLYGTTSQGGAYNYGTVFSLNPTSGAESVIHSFAGFRNNDGESPYGGLVYVNGLLYGTTTSGGAGSNGGTVFSINPNTGAESVVYSFGSGTDATYPVTTLIDVGGLLYGTTYFGGASGYGAVFSVDPGTGAETVVYSFTGGTDGKWPLGGLVNVSGVLYGTTYAGGVHKKGAVISVDPSTGTEKTVYSFKGPATGAYPTAGLVQVGGLLYGTTAGNQGVGGCTPGCGTVFSIKPATGAMKLLYSFQGGSDGATPAASLIDVSGKLYGTTEYGGSGCDCGTVFSVEPRTGAEQVIYAFGGVNDGSSPLASLIDVGAALYGTTYTGGNPDAGCGSTGCGTVFSIAP